MSDDSDFRRRREAQLKRHGTIFIEGDPFHPPAVCEPCGSDRLHAQAKDRITSMSYDWVCTECGRPAGEIEVPWEHRRTDASLREIGFEVV